MQTSQKIGGQWSYSVAFPPEPKQRKAWTLVTGIKPFQLRPIGGGLPDTVSFVPSTAQVADGNWTGSMPPRAFSDQVPVARRSMRSNAATTIGLGSGDEAIENKSNQPSAFTPVVQSACATVSTVPGSSLPGSDEESLIQRQTPAKPRFKHISAIKEAQKPMSSSIGTNNSGHRTLCPHNRRKTLCPDCMGGSICTHGKQKSWCTLCGGNALCVHGKPKSRCAQCGGKGLCVHSRVRGKCKQCSP